MASTSALTILEMVTDRVHDCIANLLAFLETHIMHANEERSSRVMRTPSSTCTVVVSHFERAQVVTSPFRQAIIMTIILAFVQLGSHVACFKVGPCLHTCMADTI